MEKQTLQQTLWEGDLSQLPLVVKVQQDILNIDRRLYNAQSLKPSCTLVNSNGDEVITCKNCLTRGISSCIALSKWTLVPGSDPKLKHAIDAKVKILCNGILGHKSKDSYSLNLVIKIT